MFRSLRVARGMKSLSLFSLSIAITTACGSEEINQRSNSRTLKNGADATAADGKSADSVESPRLAQADTDQVVSTLVIDFGDDGLSLADPTKNEIKWIVDMEEREDVNGSVAPLKYLRVKGDLTVPMNAENREYDVGCLFVEMKDNVYYREKTWLRIAGTGIKGVAYPDVKLPFSVDMGGWKNVPELESSITLQEFAGNTIKKFDGTLCFRLDFSNAPADAYKGQLIVQYLRPGAEPNPVPCDRNVAANAAQCAPQDPPPAPQPPVVTPPAPLPTPAFACTSAPVVLKAKQTTEFTWTAGNYRGLDIRLAADNVLYKGALGTIQMKNATTAIYTAPDAVPQGTRILATAIPVGLEQLPAFCEVTLIKDEDICAPDDGEIQGVVGNVFKIPANTSKLPNLDAMTPIDQVVVPNLDIPTRAFDKGFPGVRDLVEWFAIRFKGQIIIPAAGQCSFKVTSDDGANLYINGVKIVDNDGTHPPQSKTGNVTLTAGQHAFRVDYYQGPRVLIALELFWKCGDATSYTIVPPSAFVRPLQ